VLFRSQPHVSGHVAALERALGVQLFDRSFQPIQLTPEGRALLPLAEAFLQQLDFLAHVTESTQNIRGNVRVGLYPSTSCWVFPRLLPVVARTHPNVKLVLCEGQSADLSDALAAGEIDIAVRPVIPLVNSETLEFAHLWQEPLVAVVAANHPLAQESAIAPERLLKYDLVTVGATEVSQRHQFEVNLAFAQAGVQPTIAHQTNQPQTLINLARLGCFVGVTNMLAAQTANHADVVLVPISGGAFRRQVGLWKRTDRPLSPSTRAVYDAILSLGAPNFGVPTAAESAPIQLRSADGAEQPSMDRLRQFGGRAARP
jgi:DNA-binding transcriptional LysR family regulator